MKRTASFEKVHGTQIVSNAKNHTIIDYSPDTIIPPKRRQKSTFSNIFEHYSITIKPKLHRSNSLSDLTGKGSDFTLDFVRHTSKVLLQNDARDYIHGSSGDGNTKYCTKDQTYKTFMSWNLKGKKLRKKEMSPEKYTSKFSNEYVEGYQARDEDESTDQNMITSADNSSPASGSQVSIQRAPVFPFKSTPSGNLKVQSNQVVFQSSTVGVLLADPTQAKVKVKFEGNSDDTNEETDKTFLGQEDSDLQSSVRDVQIISGQAKASYPTERGKPKMSGKDDRGKNLNSLGYALAEPVDWLRVQLPKKQDLFQEFYRRIHNYINTDTVVHIGKEDFHCHQIVLQMYSKYFETKQQHEIQLPADNVSPEAFQSIYEWMIFSGPDSNKVLKRENVLEIFCAAQYLSIKDLEDQCWTFVVSENLFMEDSAFALFREARAKGLVPVMDLMVPRVMRFFLPLVASNDFLGLEADEVMTFLKSNYICVTSEIEVLMAGVRWLHGDWPARASLATEVMRCVRFGLISPWQLVDIKRNPDNAEILEIVNEHQVQQMVDDGLAYVIIKYWYGNNSKNYYHWIDVLGLSEPAERNWIGEEKNHVTYKDFLKYLEQYMVPKEQMYQQMAMMQPPRRHDDVPVLPTTSRRLFESCDNIALEKFAPSFLAGSLRGLDGEKVRPKMDFPLPATLAGLSDKGKPFPTMSDFLDSRKQPGIILPEMVPAGRSPSPEMDMSSQMQQVLQDRRRSTDTETKIKQEEQRKQAERHKQMQDYSRRPQQIQQIHMCTVEPRSISKRVAAAYERPERDSVEDLNTTTESSSSSTNSSLRRNRYHSNQNDGKRYSVAASYLAAATNALSGTQPGQRRDSPPSRQGASHAAGSGSPSREPRSSVAGSAALEPPGQGNSPQISLFNQSKESLAKINMNKLSTSILGPANKNYIAEGSLFNWDRETVLVFGGIDPHNSYGVGKNSGKDIYRYDPVTNVWDNVGELPEPRHHHSVAFLRGRVYLVGGADPRDDDIRGKSVVVSTVWSYEPVSRSWYSESGLATPRKNFGLVAHRMALYAIGGQDKRGRVLRSVEKFDPKTGSWSEVRPMSISRMAVASVKYREYIWVAGGMTGERKKPVCSIVECYNSKTNDWTEIHSLRFPRCFATLFAMNDRLYIVGGAGKVSEKDKTASSVGAIDVWDWKERIWRQETEMSIPRHGHALAYLGTQLIIIGGVTTIYMRALSNVESFCCERSAWIRGVTPLPSPLSGHGSVTLPPASLM